MPPVSNEAVNLPLAREIPASDRFDRLWSRERERVWRLCVHLSGNRDRADDLTQEVALKAHAAFGTFRGRSSPSTWLYRIAVNAALRERENHRPAAGLDEVSERGKADDDTLNVRLALDRLPGDQRTALLLSVYEGLTCKEIAAVLEIPVGTVLSRIHRARQRLREELSDEDV